MINIDLYLDKVFKRSYQYEDPVTIKELISREDLDSFETISFKLNNVFTNSSKIIAEDAKIECVGFESEEGFRIYQDSAIFVMAKAFYNLFPKDWNLVVEHSIGDGIYCEVFGAESFCKEETNRIKEEMNDIVSKQLYIEQAELTLSDAKEIFTKQGRKDVVKNLRYNHRGYVSVFRCNDYYDYYIRQLCDNTGIITEFELINNGCGIIIRFPLKKTRKIKPEFKYPKKLFAIHQEADKWLNILDIHNVSDLNEKVDKFEILHDIQIEEALHEMKLVNIAKQIKDHKNIKAVFIAGPTSSGKTTFAKRLAIQLEVNGIKPVVIGLDEYFLPRKLTPRHENGEYDFENIHAIDLVLFNNNLSSLLKGDAVELPKYNFLKGIREKSNHIIKLDEQNVIMIEGIHGLNEELSAAIPEVNKFLIYISCLNQLNIDNHNRIATTYFRKIRRIVRDNYFRGYSAEVTLERWPSISEGEDRNIFPFQENADVMFNSGLTYEIHVLKKHVFPLLYQISKYSPCYTEAQKMIFLIEHMLDIPDDMVPSNSIIREFIGSSIFKY